jgi:hypothetical protein
MVVEKSYGGQRKEEYRIEKLGLKVNRKCDYGFVSIAKRNVKVELLPIKRNGQREK